jgi:DNA polymerase-1
MGDQPVDRVVDILALMGDSVDNIPGIAWAKTASKLLMEYGSVENILDNAKKRLIR